MVYRGAKTRKTKSGGTETTTGSGRVTRRDSSGRKISSSKKSTNRSRLQDTLTRGLKDSGVDYSNTRSSRRRRGGGGSSDGPRLAQPIDQDKADSYSPDQDKADSYSPFSKFGKGIAQENMTAPESRVKQVMRATGMLPPLTGTGSVDPEGNVRIMEGEEIKTPAVVGLGSAGAAAKGVASAGKNVLTNAYWKGQNAVAAQLRAGANLQKAADKIVVGAGQVISKKGVVSTVQSNSKVRSTIAEIFKKVFTSTTTQLSTNPATGKVTTKIIQSSGGVKPILAVMATIGTIAYIAEKTFGGRVFGKFIGQEEAGQGAGMAVWVAQQAGATTGDYENYFAARELQIETLTQASSVGEYMPFKYSADQINRFANITLRSGNIMDKAVHDKMEYEQNATSMVDEWRLRDQEQSDMYKQSQLDNFEMQKQLIELREASKRRGDRASARMWAQFAEDKRIAEAAEREEIRLFWEDYWKMKQALYENSAPSKLNFGIV